MYRTSRVRIFQLLRSPRIDFKEPIPPLAVYPGGPGDKPIPTWFLAPTDCPKFQHRPHRLAELIPLESIPGLLKSLTIRALL
jgi:hypothetical protein